MIYFDPILQVENKFLKSDLPILKIGDKVRVGLKIIEGNKERVQYYVGIIIAMRNSTINSTITVRKSVQETGIERVFLVHSPKISSINVLQSSKIRQNQCKSQYSYRKLRFSIIPHHFYDFLIS